MEHKDSEIKISFGQVMASVLSAFLGVQKNERRVRDFTHGKPSQFVLAGIILTILFILLVFSVVKLVMHFVVI